MNNFKILLYYIWSFITPNKFSVSYSSCVKNIRLHLHKHFLWRRTGKIDMCNLFAMQLGGAVTYRDKHLMLNIPGIASTFYWQHNTNRELFHRINYNTSPKVGIYLIINYIKLLSGTIRSYYLHDECAMVIENVVKRSLMLVNKGSFKEQLKYLWMYATGYGVSLDYTQQYMVSIKDIRMRDNKNQTIGSFYYDDLKYSFAWDNLTRTWIPAIGYPNGITQDDVLILLLCEYLKHVDKFVPKDHKKRGFHA